jgi:hypothetical protein
MTTPEERMRSLRSAEHLLHALAYSGKKLTVREIKERARNILHHWPMPVELAEIAKKAPGWLS